GVLESRNQDVVKVDSKSPEKEKTGDENKWRNVSLLSKGPVGKRREVCHVRSAPDPDAHSRRLQIYAGHSCAQLELRRQILPSLQFPRAWSFFLAAEFSPESF